MRYVIIALTMFSFLALGGCDKLAKAFEDVQEEAPGICKKDCAEYIDCTWGESYDISGDKESGAKKESEDQCVAMCAWSINYGMYVYEVDYEDEEIEYVGHVSGAQYEKYLKCLFEYKDCNHDYWYVDLDIHDDEDDCEDYAACVAILGIDLEFEWNDDDDYCESDGKENIDGVEGDDYYYYYYY